MDSDDDVQIVDDNDLENDDDELEKCCFGGKVFEVPQVFCTDEDIFKEVLSLETWENELTPEQRENLKMLLPTFVSSDEKEKDETLKRLFSGENLKFGNPLDQVFQKLTDGFLAPDVMEAEKVIKQAMYQQYLDNQKSHHFRLFKQILISRKKLLEAAYMMPPDTPVKMQQFAARPKDAILCERTRLRYFSILQDVRDECGEPDTSSEDENYPESSPPKITRKHKKQLQILEASLSPEINRVLSTTAYPPGYPGSSHYLNRCLDMIEVSEERYREMLQRYKQKKLLYPMHPELDISKVDLNDMITRANLSKRPLLKLENHPKKKPKVQENNEKLNKTTPVVENDKHILETKTPAPAILRTQEEFNFALNGGKCDGNLTIVADNMNQSEAKTAQQEVENEFVPDNVASPIVPEYYPSSFFSLLRNIFWESNEMKISASKLEEKVRVWQQETATNAVMAGYEWTNLHDTWSDLVSSALRFLAGDLISILPENFVPFLDYKEKQQQWHWIGSGRDSEEQLNALCQHWLENKDDVSLDVLESSQGSPPPPRVLTGWTVRATTDGEKFLYREQERIRYQNPHKAYTFKVHGYESVVGPVKGVYGKEGVVNKAREHSLLVSDRPPFVTILSLVRDAAARLPNGEGTRADICELLKDSQYLSLASDQQIHTVVSGALDRLHYEKDPCVKYDVNRKLWIYLHRSRTEGEFERIHQAQAAAAKARKAVQKSKTPKPKNRDACRASIPCSTTLSSASDSSSGFLNIDVTSVSPVLSQSPRAVGSPRTQGSPKLSHPSVNRHLVRNLNTPVQPSAKVSLPVIADSANISRKSELFQTKLASTSSSTSSSSASMLPLSVRYSAASSTVATSSCSQQHSITSGVFSSSFTSDSSNSRPPSQGSVQSLPSPKTVIANVNAAQFVGVGSLQVGSSNVEHSASSSSTTNTPCIGVLSVDMKPSSPSFVGQPPVLQPVLSHQALTPTTSSFTCASTAMAAAVVSTSSTSYVTSTSTVVPRAKLVATHHASGSKSIPGFQTIVIKPDGALRSAGNLSSLPLLSTKDLTSTDSSVLNNNPVVARLLHGSQLLSLGNIMAGATSGNILKQGTSGVQNFKIQGTNFNQQQVLSAPNVNIFQPSHSVASISSELKLPNLSAVNQESSGQESTLLSSASLLGSSATLSFNRAANVSLTDTKVVTSSQRDLSDMKRLTIPSHSLSGLKHNVTDLGRILDSAGAPNHVISSTSAITANLTNTIVGKSSSAGRETQDASLKPLTSTYVMTSPVTNASMLSGQHGLRATTSLNMRALHSIKVIPVPQSLGSGKNLRNAPLLARIISPSTGMTLRTTALPNDLIHSTHQLKGATTMSIVHGLQSVASQSHILKAATTASHPCTSAEVPSNQPFIIQVQAPKTANEDLNNL